MNGMKSNYKMEQDKKLRQCIGKIKTKTLIGKKKTWMINEKKVKVEKNLYLFKKKSICEPIKN